MLENRPECFFHWLALNALGASVVPMHPEWRSGELQYLIRHAEIVLAVVPAEALARLEDADVHPEMRKAPLALEVAVDAELLPLAPADLARADHEPAVAVRHVAELRHPQRRLTRHGFTASRRP